MAKEIQADLHKELDKDNTDKSRTEVLKDALLDLFDKVLNDGKIEDTATLGKLARIRSRIEIEFGQL